jgi:hypothetical protein
VRARARVCVFLCVYVLCAYVCLRVRIVGLRLGGIECTCYRFGRGWGEKSEYIICQELGEFHVRQGVGWLVEWDLVCMTMI